MRRHFLLKYCPGLEIQARDLEVPNIFNYDFSITTTGDIIMAKIKEEKNKSTANRSPTRKDFLKKHSLVYFRLSEL